MTFDEFNNPDTYRFILSQFLGRVWHYPLWAWTLTAAMLSVALVGVSRVRRFTRADWPLLSPFIRDWLATPIYWLAVAGIVAAGIVTCVAISLAWLGNAIPELFQVAHSRINEFGFGGTIGAAAGMFLRYWFVPYHERGEPLADVELGPPIRVKDYDPCHYFHERRGIFFDTDSRGHPAYVPLAVARQHTQIIGATGQGKGVAAQVVLPQFALLGEATFVFDPKDDKFLPEVLSAFCSQHGLPFRFIDLRPSAPPQVNLLAGVSERDLTTLLNAGFDLADSGGLDRVYRLDDRRAAATTAALVARDDVHSLPDLFAVAAADKTISDARVFFGFLQELAALPVFATDTGCNLGQCLDEPGITYIVGSTLDPVVVMAQKMLLLRVLQLIYGRPRNDEQRWVTMFIDEFKYLLSAPAVNGLGVVRDFNCHVIVAHQSLGDLHACPGVPPAVVSGAVRDNTNLKLVYRPIDDTTAEWAQALSGTTQRHAETVGKSVMDGANDGSWRATEVPLIHRNDLFKLPKMAAVFYGDGNARYITMRPLRCRGPRPEPQAALSNLQMQPAVSPKDLI